MLEIVELFNLKGKGAWIESLANSWIAVREQHDRDINAAMNILIEGERIFKSSA